MSDLFSHFYGGHYGPYGSNVGDTWFAADWLQEKLAEDPERGPSYRAIIYVQERDGKIQETIYVTQNPELIEEARQGTIKWARARANLN